MLLPHFEAIQNLIDNLLEIVRCCFNTEVETIYLVCSTVC